MSGDKSEDELLKEKLELFASIPDSISMDMIAYEYAVRAGVDPKTAAQVYSVKDIIEDAEHTPK